jgi:hypothetical protein
MTNLNLLFVLTPMFLIQEFYSVLSLIRSIIFRFYKVFGYWIRSMDLVTTYRRRRYAGLKVTLEAVIIRLGSLGNL